MDAFSGGNPVIHILIAIALSIAGGTTPLVDIAIHGADAATGAVRSAGKTRTYFIAADTVT
jgi:hypothetical protein